MMYFLAVLQEKKNDDAAPGQTGYRLSKTLQEMDPGDIHDLLGFLYIRNNYGSQ